MRRDRLSLLILRGRPKRRRIRVRRASATNAVRDQRISDLEAAEDRREREGSQITSAFLMINVFGYRLHTVEENYRHVAAATELNAAKIAALEAREVPGWTAKDKRMAFDLTIQNSEEVHGLREEVRLLIEVQRIRSAWAERIERRVANLERVVGEDSDV